MRTILSVNSVIKQSANWNGGWKRVSLCVGRSVVSDSWDASTNEDKGNFIYDL